MTAPQSFRAQCASCMRVNHDPEALKCPGCGSSRLVVMFGTRPRPAARPINPLDPQPIHLQCSVCGAPPGTLCDMGKHGAPRGKGHAAVPQRSVQAAKEERGKSAAALKPKGHQKPVPPPFEATLSRIRVGAGDDGPVSRLIFGALEKLGDHHEVTRNSDGSLEAPVAVVIEALREML